MYLSRYIGAAPPAVLDLLGLDPQPLDGVGTGMGGGASNGARKNNASEVNGDGGGCSDGAMEGGLPAPLMLEMALAPSMMGPVGAARGAASELAALMGEVRFWTWGRRGGGGGGGLL